MTRPVFVAVPLLHLAVLCATGAATAACSRAPAEQGAQGESDPAVGPTNVRVTAQVGSATKTATSGIVAAAASMAPSGSTFLDRAPTAEESTPTAVAPFKPLIPDATIKSTLPCPKDTKLMAQDTVLVCRASAAPGSIPSKEGPSLWFHKSGKLRSQGAYANNKRTGHWWELREDGSIDNEGDYVDGERDGLFITYYPDGSRMSEAHLKRGKLDGISRTWNKDKKLLVWKRYENGTAVEVKNFR